VIRFAPGIALGNLSSMQASSAILSILRSVLVTTVHRLVPASYATVGAYVALGGSVILVEELAPVLAGFAAHQDHLPIYRTIIACALGGWLATLVPYWLGRYGRRRLLARFPKSEETTKRLTHVVGKRQWQSALASRFLFGARFLLPLASGAAHVRRTPFLVGSAISSAAWGALYVWLGYLFGDAMVVLLSHVRRHEFLIGTLLAIALVLILVLAAWKNRPHVEQELESFPD
jgi:membrane protein DedA with SNARE-associated domain